MRLTLHPKIGNNLGNHIRRYPLINYFGYKIYSLAFKKFRTSSFLSLQHIIKEKGKQTKRKRILIQSTHKRNITQRSWMSCFGQCQILEGWICKCQILTHSNSSEYLHRHIIFSLAKDTLKLSNYNCCFIICNMHGYN